MPTDIAEVMWASLHDHKHLTIIRFFPALIMGSDAFTCPRECNSRKSPRLRGSVHLLDFFLSTELYSDMKFNVPVILKHLALLNTGVAGILSASCPNEGAKRRATSCGCCPLLVLHVRSLLSSTHVVTMELPFSSFTHVQM